MRRPWPALAGTVTCLAAISLAASGTLVVSSHSEAPPAGLPAAIAGVLAAGGQQVTGSVRASFWWVRTLAAGRDALGASEDWQDVAQGALVGVVRVDGPLRDIRGRTIPPGLYTLRFGLQPANGDHLGVSPYREFLLVSPAAIDTQAGSSGHEGTVALAQQTVGSSHPAVLSIDPPATQEAVGRVSLTEAGHEAIVVEVGRAGGRSLRFGLILRGLIEA